MNNMVLETEDERELTYAQISYINYLWFKKKNQRGKKPRFNWKVITECISTIIKTALQQHLQ